MTVLVSRVIFVLYLVQLDINLLHVGTYGIDACIKVFLSN